MVVTLPTVYLEAPKDGIKERPILEKIAAIYTDPVGFIKSPTKAIQDVRDKRRRIISGDTQLKSDVTKSIIKNTATALTATFLATAPISTLGATARGVGAVAKKVAVSPTVTKTVAGVGAVAVFAPKTFKKFIQTPGASQVVLASAINPLAGVATAIEKGGGILGSAVKTIQDDPSIKNVLTGLAGAGAIAGAGVLGATKGREILNAVVPGIKNKLTSPGPSTSPVPITLPTSSPGSIQSSSSSPLIEEPATEPPKVSKTPAIKNVFKPQINIAIAQ